MSRYNPKKIESFWQKVWNENNTFTAIKDSSKPKYYVLEMFPYPSGRIHMGHVRNYTMGDVIARYKLACGYSVLHPMGWDAFGMPAENAAMAIGANPREWTYSNIADMREQMKPLGLSIDWSREFATCDPEYYGQQQALFLDMLKEGLIYRKNATVNWDPVDLTVLANEQVIDGKGWRSGAPVERKELTQWFFKITEYSEDLLNTLEKMPAWPDKVRLMQSNWIGKSQGLKIKFNLSVPIDSFKSIEVYTTRPDTLMGASFIGISPDHPLSKTLESQNPKLAKFNSQIRQSGTSEEVIEKGELPMMLIVYAVIIILVFLTYFDWRATICCTVPLTFATMLGYAFMDIAQIGLKVSTLPVMVLAVGVGVDYAFYIYNRLNTHLKSGLDMTEAFEIQLLADCKK